MPTAPTLQKLAMGLRVGIVFTGAGILLMPFAGKSKPKANEVVESDVYRTATADQFFYKTAGPAASYRPTPEKEYVS